MQLNSAYLRRIKFTGYQYRYYTTDDCHDSVLNKLLEDIVRCNGPNPLHRHLNIIVYAPFNVYGKGITPQTVPMTESVVVVLELQNHVRICTSVDNI